MPDTAPDGPDALSTISLERLPLGVRILYAIGGGILPILYFALSFERPPNGPSWQSGEFADYLTLLLGGPATYVFYPLLAYSTLSLIVTIICPMFCARRWPYRFGVYSGAILALHFSLILTVANLADNPGLLQSFLTIAAWACLLSGMTVVAVRGVRRKRASRRFFCSRNVLILSFILFAVYSIPLKGVRAMRSPDDVLLVLALYPLLAASYWAFVTYGFLSLQILHTRLPSAPARVRWGYLAAWLGAYAATLWLSIVRAIEMYNSLPTEPPENCYISTAAARGHPGVVGSQVVANFRVNRQMRVFKCAEIALLALAPRLHRACRRVYDRAGPRLAACLVHPLAADAAYLALKPWEWLCLGALKVSVPDLERRLQQLYPTATEPGCSGRCGR
ncbi:MAG: DUF6688 family protein [Planctomycetota bacterium]